MRPLIAVVGNTGVGKSQLAVELARAFRGEVINADAMQMYKGVDIITNKHPLNEQHGVPHHLLGTDNWTEPITVQDFEPRANGKINELQKDEKLPIVVGGTHYYIQSLIAENTLVNTNSTPQGANAPKNFTSEQLTILDDPKLVEQHLHKVDPLILQKFHPNDTRRTRRALEIFYETGKKPSEIYETQKTGSETEKVKLRHRVLVFWVWCNRDVLNERLDARVDKMVQNGLMDEIKEIYAQYNGKNEGIFQVLGFKQFLPYLDELKATGVSNSTLFEEGLNSMKTETRQYAKKQRKWIKNKLSSFVNELGGDFAIVDSSDLSHWDENVNQRAINIVNKWLKDDDSLTEQELVPEYLSSESVRDRQVFDKSQWTRHHCETCSELRGRDVTLVGDEDWRIHTESKAHRSAKRRLEKVKNM